MLNSYDKYKESECIWLDKVPQHWNETRLKYVLTKMNYESKPDDKLLICSNKGEVFYRGKSRMGLVADDDSIYQGVRKGNLLIHGMDTWHGAIAVSNYDGMCTPVVHVCESNENKNYIKYYLQALAFLGVYKKITNGVRENTSDFRSWTKAGAINLILPPRDEQDIIVDYLNWKSNEIKKFVLDEKKELILLRELLNTKLRDVQSTTLVRLDRLLELKFVPVEVDKNTYYQKAGMHNRGQGIFLRTPIKGNEVGDSKFQWIKKDCLMLSGQFSWEGAVYLTTDNEEKGIVSHRYYLLHKKSRKISLEYIWAYFMSDRGMMDLNNCSHGAAGRNRPLNINELLKCYIPLPQNDSDLLSLVEIVRAIMSIQFLNKEKFNHLEELRRKTIIDVALGMVDVRNISIPDYVVIEEVEDEESDDEEE